MSRSQQWKRTNMSRSSSNNKKLLKSVISGSCTEKQDDKMDTCSEQSGSEYEAVKCSRPAKRSKADVKQNVQRDSRPAFEFDLSDIEKSGANLLSYINNQTIRKRDSGPMAEFIQGWLRLQVSHESTVGMMQREISKLKQRINELETEGIQETRGSFAEIVKRHSGSTFTKQIERSMKKATASENIIIVESQTNTSAKDLFKTYIDSPKLKLKINSVKIGRNGKAIIFADDSKQLAVIESEIKSRNITELTVRKAKETSYRISIDNVELSEKSDYKKLINVIMTQNDHVNLCEGSLKPLFATKRKNNYTVVFAADKQTRSTLTSDGFKVFIGHQSHTFRDYLIPVKCFKCNKFGHTNSNCKTPDAQIRCNKCDQFGHETRKCESKGVHTPTPHCPSCHDWHNRMHLNDKSKFAHWPDLSICPTRTALIEKERIKLNLLLNPNDQ